MEEFSKCLYRIQHMRYPGHSRLYLGYISCYYPNYYYYSSRRIQEVLRAAQIFITRRIAKFSLVFSLPSRIMSEDLVVVFNFRQLGCARIRWLRTRLLSHPLVV
jgi:hypothetical protein